MRPRLAGTNFSSGIAVDDDIGTLASKVFSANALLPAFAALPLLALVVLFDLTVHESLHLLLSLTRQNLLLSRKMCFDRKQTRLHTDGDVLVFFGGGNDTKREDRRGVLESTDDVPACSFENLDMAVQCAGQQTFAIVGK